MLTVALAYYVPESSGRSPEFQATCAEYPGASGRGATPAGAVAELLRAVRKDSPAPVIMIGEGSPPEQAWVVFGGETLAD